VLAALTLSDVPIDVLAERLNTTRGALYETLREAGAELRRHLRAVGLALIPERGREPATSRRELCEASVVAPEMSSPSAAIGPLTR
jgi:hypothetical protein